MQLKRRTPLIAEPPKQPESPKKTALPMRSRRIAAQHLDYIAASKRGDVLLMRKMGVLPATTAPSSASRRTYDAVFNANLSAGDVQAFDDMFQATKTRGARTGRRPVAARA